jgi:DNA-binding beta-propeller fold protein YncE
VVKVNGSDGRQLEEYTGATGAYGVMVGLGRVFITGDTSPGRLYVIDTQVSGSVTTVSTALGNSPRGITTDGSFIWTANAGGGSVSRVNPAPPGLPTNFTAGFSEPEGILFDGANLWVTDQGDNTVKKLDSNGNVLLSVPVGADPQFPEFDGSNIWVPNYNGHSVTVVRVKDGMVLATLTGNGLSFPVQAAFDGEHILVTDLFGNGVSLWKATDLTPLGFVAGPGTAPFGACSDGINFWLTLKGTNQLARF